MSVSNTHGEQLTVVESSAPYSCKNQCDVSTGTFLALIEEGISGNILQQHSIVPQQTFSTVATLQ
jgi:hypothetical protein